MAVILRVCILPIRLWPYSREGVDDTLHPVCSTNRPLTSTKVRPYPHRYSRDDSGFEMRWDPDPWRRGFDPSHLPTPLSVGL